MFDWLFQPWPWYVSGIIIGIMVPLLLWIGNKSLGISSSMRHMCAIAAPAKIPFFSYDWRKHVWNLVFVGGLFIGGIIGGYFLGGNAEIAISEATKADLRELGITDFSGLMPQDLFGIDAIFSSNGLIFLVIGGFLVGFGTRYAGGCTSGHTIFGLATLQWPSLVATISFFVGGLLVTHLVLPFLL
jgi:uncharacterized protein